MEANVEKKPTFSYTLQECFDDDYDDDSKKRTWTYNIVSKFDDANNNIKNCANRNGH